MVDKTAPLNKPPYGSVDLYKMYKEWLDDESKEAFFDDDGTDNVVDAPAATASVQLLHLPSQPRAQPTLREIQTVKTRTPKTQIVTTLITKPQSATSLTAIQTTLSQLIRALTRRISLLCTSIPLYTDLRRLPVL